MTMKIKITKIPLVFFSYFQYFLLSIGIRSKKENVKISLPMNPLVRIMFYSKNKFLLWISRRIYAKLFRNKYLLEGYFVNEDRTKKRFCYDIADSPYFFDEDALNDVDIYFKMQTPADIKDATGFNLNDHIFIPYSETVLRNKHKIFPTVGQISLGINLNMCDMQKALDEYSNRANLKKTGRVTSYFGHAKGVVPIYPKGMPNFQSEREIMGYYEGKINHPNEKRAKASEILNSFGNGYDARVIRSGTRDDSGKEFVNTNLIVPMPEYYNFLAKFEYNLNISGFRLSIPKRFLESFIVDTAVITDKLAVKWYEPFEKEVFETVKMGYNPMEEIDWSKFKDDIAKLPHIEKGYVLQRFKDKWSPAAFGKYIFNVLKSK